MRAANFVCTSAVAQQYEEVITGDQLHPQEPKELHYSCAYGDNLLDWC